VVTLRVLEVDVLECAADVIFLPFDGALPTSAGGVQIDRSLGRIARAFARRYPDCDLVDEIESQVAFPVPLGRAATVELPPGSPFRAAALLSTLAHAAADTGEAALLAAMRGAFAHALRLCGSLAATSAATPVLTGGWRLQSSAVTSAMLQELAAARGALTLSLCILGDPAAAVRARDLSRALGFE
jgi:hypothetical protein